jgi:ArsR family transcriptional regulator, arsenate/arsenite/antimonite-responsive transcriptional repressor
MRQEEVFKALADPSRRKVLRLLQSGSMSAGDLAREFDFSAPSMSHHLSLLKAADLVRTERRGQSIVYSLNTSVLEDASRFLLDLLDVGEEGKK